MRIGEILHGGTCRDGQIFAAARHGIVESRSSEPGQNVVVYGMEADRHAASGQGRNRIAFEYCRGGKSEGNLTHPAAQIPIALAGNRQFSRPAFRHM